MKLIPHNLIPTGGALILLIPSSHAATVDIGWTAEGQADGPLATWTASTNTTGGTRTWQGGTGGTKASGTSNFVTVSDWVSTPSYTFNGTSWHTGISDAVTKQDASWEMVFRPGDFTGDHMLFNTGGAGSGTAFIIQGSTLQFRAQETSSAANQAFVSFDLSTLGPATDFYHVVGTADTGPTGSAQLFVNGNLVASTTTTGTLNDWDGAETAGLGGANFNIPGNNPFPADTFTGDIATFNWYGNEILTASEVSSAFDAIAVPEPSSMILSLLGLGFALRRRRS